MILETIQLFGVEAWAKVYPKPQILTFKWPSLDYFLKGQGHRLCLGIQLVAIWIIATHSIRACLSSTYVSYSVYKTVQLI